MATADTPTSWLVERMRQGDPSAWTKWSPRSLTAEELRSAWIGAVADDKRPTHAYVHFPHCETSCRFCMYWHRVPKDADAVSAQAERLARTIASYGELGRTRLAGAYFGGGTPSLLAPSDLERVLRAFREAFDVRGRFTVEGNPLSTDEARIALAARYGVTRWSFGVQAFDPELLKRIGRVNVPEDETRKLVAAARRHGLDTNVDLLYGLPGQTPEMFHDAVLRAVELGSDSITLYRYQSVDRLPHEGASTAGFLDLPRRRLLARGYVYSRENEFGARAYAVRALPKAIGTLWAGEYSCFEHIHVNLIGIGTGAWGHAYGRLWYRDVTPLRDGASFAAWGSPLTPEDEVRTAVLRALHRGTWFKRSDVSWLGVAAVAALDEALRQGGLQEALGRLRRTGRAAEAVERLVDGLLPEGPDPSPAWPEDQEGLHDLLADGGRRGTVPRGAAIDSWLELLRDGDGLGFVREEERARFAVRGSPDLAVRVGWRGRDAAYAQSARFSLYVDGSPLTPGQEAVARRLARLMAERDPPPSPMVQSRA